MNLKKYLILKLRIIYLHQYLSRDILIIKCNYKINLTIGDTGYQTSIGRTKSEDTARKTVSFATDLSNDSSNIDTDSSKINMIKKYLHDLKLETGEAIHKKK